VLAGKYLYVATLGALAGVLNVAAIVVSIGPAMRSLTAGADHPITFAIPVASIPIVVLGAILMALFIGAAMMIAAAFARTFKEGQTMVSPFYFLIMLPLMFLQSPDLEFTTPLAFVPVVNLALMFRDAIVGEYRWLLIAITIAVEVVTILACLAFARTILRFEDVLMGSFNGSVFKFVKSRLLGSSRRGRVA
jgi:sodium transport system permease protein